MIIDGHVHLGKDIDGSSQNVNELLASMRKNCIGMAVVFPFNEKDVDLVKASLSLCGLNKKLIPFLRFDPKKISDIELAKLLESFDGVKLHPRSQNFDPLSKRFAPLFRVIEQSGKPVIIHTRKEDNRNTDPDRIINLAKLFPSMKLILGHFGALSRNVFEETKKRDNIFLETSVISTPMFIENVCSIVGPDKIIFGSDSPYSDQEIELLKVKKANIGADAKRAILGSNLAHLLG